VKKKIFVRGPVLSQSGYGEQARFALRCLRSKEDLFDIYINPINWGQTGWIWEDTEFRRWMDERIAVTSDLINQKQFQPDMSLQITIPNEFQKIAPLNYGYTAGIESTNVSPGWLAKANEMDGMIVISEFAKTGFTDTIATIRNEETGEESPYRMETDMTAVNYAIRNIEPEEIPNFELDKNFNFLVVSQMGPRKNMENTLLWWVEEFIDQDVGLVIKTSFKGSSQIDREFTHEYLKKLLERYPDRKCSVKLLHGDLTEGQMVSLYSHKKIKALINIAHGEGFGLPMFEAAQAALPIITIGWGGQLDFLEHSGKKYFTEVDYELKAVQAEAVWKGVLEENTAWAFADQGSFKMSLRKVKKDYKKAKTKANQLKKIILKEFTEDSQFEQFCNAIYNPSEEEKEWMEELSKIEVL
jgi:glycosyltransferase involved in cell wall biosynthesis